MHLAPLNASPCIVVQVSYPEIFEKLQSSQSAHEKSSINEDELQKTVRKVEMQCAETDQKRATAEKLVAELRAELGRFFKLPSPCGGVCVTVRSACPHTPCWSALQLSRMQQYVLRARRAYESTP